MKSFFRFLKLFIYIGVTPLVIFIRILRPFYLIRLDRVHDYIGHFAGDLELYICARDLKIDTPNQRYIDLFCVYPIRNEQLFEMWKRILPFYPASLLYPMIRVNNYFPGGSVHLVNTHWRAARDVNSWLGQCKTHLRFTSEEENRGEKELRQLGLPQGARFICLLVRDSAYHKQNYSISNRHQFRDADVQQYVFMAEKLSDMGFYVVRVGAAAEKKIESRNPKIIDYTFSKLRSDFLDIYIGSICEFIVTTGTGYETVPICLFRKPAVYTNFAQFGHLPSFSNKFVVIMKRYIDLASGMPLSLSELKKRGAELCDSTASYAAQGIGVLENTPGEICDVTLEMVERLNGTWKPTPEDDMLQKRFWNLYPIGTRDLVTHSPLHGKIRTRFGAQFLRDNHDWFLK